MKDLYEKFAQDYDEFGPVEEYLGAEHDFFLKLFDEHGVKTVLDCACGTGQHLYMLAQAGYKVFGSDYSAPMLKVAQWNLEKKGMSIPLLQCDFRCLEKEFDQTFDAVVCLTSALPHLHTDEDLGLYYCYRPCSAPLAWYTAPGCGISPTCCLFCWAVAFRSLWGSSHSLGWEKQPVASGWQAAWPLWRF